MGRLLAQLRASFEVIPIQGIEQPIYPERRLLVMIFTFFCGLAYFVWGLRLRVHAFGLEFWTKA